MTGRRKTRVDYLPEWQKFEFAMTKKQIQLHYSGWSTTQIHIIFHSDALTILHTASTWQVLSSMIY